MFKEIGKHLTIKGPYEWSPDMVDVEISNVDIDGTTLSIDEIKDLHEHLGKVIAKIDSLTNGEADHRK